MTIGLRFDDRVDGVFWTNGGDGGGGGGGVGEGAKGQEI